MAALKRPRLRERAVAVGTGDPPYCRMIGRSGQQSGDFETGVRAYKTVEAIEPVETQICTPSYLRHICASFIRRPPISTSYAFF